MINLTLPEIHVIDYFEVLEFVSLMIFASLSLLYSAAPKAPKPKKVKTALERIYNCRFSQIKAFAMMCGFCVLLPSFA